MIPPKGFKAEQYPLQHKILYGFGLSAVTPTMNTCLATLVRGTADMDVNADTIQVNPHNTSYEEDVGPAVRQMSIIDKLRLSIKFNMTELCASGEIVSGTFGDSLPALHFLWRPIFFSFPEKLNAVDDDTANSVATILGLTSDDANDDVVPVTTNKLPTQGVSDLLHPLSTVNTVEAITDYNMTADATMEDHVFDEELFQNAIRRFTNKGALKACVGRTRHVTLTTARPFKNFFIKQFVPRAIRRVVDRTYMGIQVHVPLSGEFGQYYHDAAMTASKAHLGVKILCTYHEWNMDHDQDMGTQV